MLYGEPVKRRHRAQRLLLSLCAATLTLLACASVASAATDAGGEVFSVWVSGPSAIWSQLRMLNSFIGNAVNTDVRTCVSAKAKVAVTDLNFAVQSVEALTTTVPAVGLQVNISTGDWTGSIADYNSTIFRCTMTNTNAYYKTYFNSTLYVLPASGPSATTVMRGNELQALSGPSFIWKILQDSVTAVERELMFAQLEVDFQAASTDASHVFLTAVSGGFVNSSAFYVNYSLHAMPDATSVAAAPTVSALATAAASTVLETQAKVLMQRIALAELPTFNARLTTIANATPEFVEYGALFPLPVTTTTPLLEDPSDSADSGDTAPLVIVENVTDEVVLYFNGSAAGWNAALTHSLDVLYETIEEAGNIALNRSEFMNRVKVQSHSLAYNKGHKIQSLNVLVQVTQGVSTLSRHTWTLDEVTSMLNGEADYSLTLAMYDASVSKDGPAVLLATGLHETFGLKCLAQCTGMVILGAVAVFLIVLTLLVAMTCVCCACPGDATEAEWKEVERRGSSAKASMTQTHPRYPSKRDGVSTVPSAKGQGQSPQSPKGRRTSADANPLMAKQAPGSPSAKPPPVYFDATTGAVESSPRSPLDAAPDQREEAWTTAVPVAAHTAQDAGRPPSYTESERSASSIGGKHE